MSTPTEPHAGLAAFGDFTTRPRMLVLALMAVPVGLFGVASAWVLLRLIALVTGVAYYGEFSTRHGILISLDRLGAASVLVPVAGALIVGLMARYGSDKIRGHGIPEALEAILIGRSRIAPKVALLKPLSSAIAIGTGGPFGAEGPIIATGGAFGSFLGQVLHVTASERKVLLAAGAAAGMAAIFASPVSATILAIELLLFELRPRSLIPVALATVAATGIRYATVGFGAVFPMPPIATPDGPALAAYVLLGAFVGLCSVGVTRIVYGIEDAFEKIPLHWMWWPAIGGVAVGAIGYFAPLTFGVGYTNIQGIVSGSFAFDALAALLVMKFLSWSIALGSGTSGGTLAPLFTIGGALGAICGQVLAAHAPGLGVDTRIAALVGMAAIFAGASRALLTSIVFAFETTRQ
ncbi:MAG: chloride channel protein, partial [Rhodospirillales bacterium]|nr:chloride channel protein [Rhodospirillales bacterium]